MDNASSSHSILDTLRTVEFRLGLKGYNVDEVDEYLEKAAVEAEQVQERLRTANERLRDATERVAQLEVELQQGERTLVAQPAAHDVQSAADPGAQVGAPAAQGAGVTQETLQRTLLLAQKFVDQTKRECEEEAAQVVSRAEERARTLLAQAEERARQIAADTEERLRSEVERLEQARTGLANEVEAMSRHLEEQKTLVRSSLVEALRWVDERMHSPTRGPGERAAKGGGAGQATDRKPSGETGGGAGGAGEQRTGAGSPGREEAAAPVRPQVASTPSGASGRPPPAAVATHPSSRPPSAVPAPDGGQAPIGARLSVVNGSLFEGSRDEPNGFDGDSLGE